ncbi:MAG: MFS transporter, partial [Gammaproteobacteria bacterium]|nr:MFS transporter [Gammaproteobacteria bacterium]
QTHYGMAGVFWFSAFAALLWCGVAWGMAPPSYLSSHLLRVGVVDVAQASELELQLRGVRGVGEATVVAEEGIAYLKIDRQQIDLSRLDEYSSGTF